MGGGRGPRTGLGRYLARGPRHRAVSPDHYRRVEGVGSTGPATCGGGGAGPATGRRSEALGGDRPGVAGGAGVAAGTRDARRPRVAAPLDLQEYAAPGCGVDAAEASRGTADRGRAAAEGGIQL